MVPVTLSLTHLTICKAIEVQSIIYFGFDRSSVNLKIKFILNKFL